MVFVFYYFITKEKSYYGKVRLTLDIRTIRYFIKTVQLGSINKAAQEFYMNHQNLGKKLANLEKELGIILLQRSKTGISLTKNGEVLYEKFLKLDSLAEDIERYAQTASDNQKQRQKQAVNLVIILPNSIFPKKVSKAILDMENRFPESNITVMESSLEKTVKKIYETENAFANVVLPINKSYTLPNDLAVWKEKKHQLVAYAPKNILQKKELEMQEFLSLPLALYGNTDNITENFTYQQLLPYGQPHIKHYSTNYVNFCDLIYTQKYVTLGWYKKQIKYYAGDTFSEFMLNGDVMQTIPIKHKGKNITAKVLWISRKDIGIRPEIEYLIKIL